MSARIEGQPAYVLHLRAYRDSSAIIDLFSRDYGYLSVVAKGLKSSSKSRQQWRAALQPGNLIQVSWQGRSELKTLVDAQLNSTFPLRGNALYCAFYINELLGRLLQPFDPQAEVFKLYGRSLLELSSGSHVEPILRSFELTLLTELGYGVDFSPIESAPEAYFIYDPEYGFCQVSASMDAHQKAFSGHLLQQLARAEWDADTLKVAKRLNRLILAPLLGDRPLNSRKLFLRQYSD